MKRAALLCLLLTACRPADPDGTLQPDAQGRTGEIVAPVGDSAPFRLTGGEMTFRIGARPADAAEACAARARLIRYGEADGPALGLPGRIFQFIDVNALEPGVYFLRTEAELGMCRLSVFAVPK